MGQYSTTTKCLLEALIPDTSRRVKRLSQKQVIQEISSSSGITTEALRSSFRRLVKRGLVTVDSDHIPRLTEKGIHQTKPFTAKHLSGSYLMVIFDIAETDRAKRNHVRLLLKELSFQQVQKSVWISSLDHREYIQAEIIALKLQKFVLLYEARQLL